MAVEVTTDGARDAPTVLKPATANAGFERAPLGPHDRDETRLGPESAPVGIYEIASEQEPSGWLQAASAELALSL